MKEIHAMRAVKSTIVAVLAFVVLALPTVVLADGRVALVLGNSTYATSAGCRTPRTMRPTSRPRSAGSGSR